MEDTKTGESPEKGPETSSTMASAPLIKKKKRSTRQRKFMWTAELDEKFMSAVDQLGGITSASSSEILKRHLEEYRLASAGISDQVFDEMPKRKRNSGKDKVLDEMGTKNSGEDQVFDERQKRNSEKDQVFDEMRTKKSGKDQVFDEIRTKNSGKVQVFDQMPKRKRNLGKCKVFGERNSGKDGVLDEMPNRNSRKEVFRKVRKRPTLGNLNLRKARQQTASVSGFEFSSKMGIRKTPSAVPDIDRIVPWRMTMFSKVLTQSDVGNLNHLVIPRSDAEKYFPKCLYGKRSLLLNFEDPTGKQWCFRCRYQNSSESYVFSNRWSLFVKEKLLHAGDIVSFYCGVGEEGKNKLFISWIQSKDAALTPSSSLNVNVYPPLVPELQSASVPVDRVVQDMDSEFKSPSPNSCDVRSSTLDESTVDDALLYCALFPPDYEFEKDTLIQLWMAIGFFVQETMERFAGLFFEDCLTKGYLQFSRTNLVTGKAMYKFKGDSQLLPKLVSRGDQVVRIESSSSLSAISPKVAHVSVRCSNSNDATALHDYQRLKHLQTLILLHGHQMSFKQVSRDFFVFLRQLRVLDLSKTCLVELPSSIGNMKCLCFLDLSGTLIKRLPEAIDCLKKLQTLKLRGCSKLSTLPKGMRKLVNLRHLDFDVFRQLRSMPESMGDLTNLRTLSAFIVGLEEGCSIRQLKNMDYLSESFCISRLENVSTKDEAEEACMSHKTLIKKLELHWSDSQNEDVKCEEILSSLRPTTILAALKISCYSGSELPSWICDPAFTKLVSITLFECENCLFLPSLGQLPSLKYLDIVGFQNLKVIGYEFYGDSGVGRNVAFPKLEKLTIENMFSLEWSGISSFAFPHLLNLTIKQCPKFHKLFALSSLCSLELLEISHCAMIDFFSADEKLPARVNTFIIEDCPLISVRFLNGGQDWQRVAHIPHVWIDHKEISYG